MTTLISSYLERLEAAAADLPVERRDELVEEIRQHIDASTAGAGSDEAALRTLLDRLGTPEEIAAAAREDLPAAARPGPWAGSARPAGTGLELAAVLMLTVGSFLPVLGWLVGVALLWTSQRWRLRDKLLGTLVVPFGPGLLLVVAALAPVIITRTCSSSSTAVSSLDGTVVEPPVSTTESCTGFGPPGWLVASVALFVLVAPVVVAAMLMRRARVRAALEQPALSEAGPSPWGGSELAAVVLLGLGSFVLPLVGPLVGLVLALSSQRWTRRDKTVAVALSVGPVVLLVVLAAAVLLLRQGT